ncbi:alanine--tRNA ligase [Candidatus Hydrogenosomobacter endosymbioticus]|uniref:Alanine--tRNA ligase n=1 Tax=Candidatus Hydrogenosomobacter endosymbioticus TaxID=2558174 RepID=A0ABM7V8T8_9PROT|nr:alanine--tRNA ligase [Candidatus Hydrogenosomobacter endosymbioticus]BDB96183.1 alanine--tRNA ligase [Candidatus Hydrogenosomobacter endosymbioticus]
MKTSNIRSSFLQFFKDKGHEIVAPSSLVPENDDSLLFTNSGMVQFKNIFIGKEQRGYSRASTCQKSVRAGGKHNDLDQVGHTARHHTFFEMLGNFSFGDYFKESAILYAWECLTKVFEISKDRLCVTVYHDDEEAVRLWKSIAGFSDDRIIRISTSDNFWSMGDTGPCGPCTEIFYDHGEHISGGKPGETDADGDRFVELWNLVFMQFEQVSKDKRVSLPKPSIDTGMGIERIAAVLQGVHDNFDIDIFSSLIARLFEISGKDRLDIYKVPSRIVVDHLRSAAFLIADGVFPSNEGRGYVLRRIMRRAIKNARSMTDDRQLFQKLMPTLVDNMGGFYKELVQAQPLIGSIFSQEYDSFCKVFENGMPVLQRIISDLLPGQALSGADAFRLYDTYGMPIDVINDELSYRGILLDERSFNELMDDQRRRSREGALMCASVSPECQAYASLSQRIPATVFTGYNEIGGAAAIKAIIVGGEEKNEVISGQSAAIVVDATPFYAESGGQASDKGYMKSRSGASFASIYEVIKVNGLFIHKVIVSDGAFRMGDSVDLNIDAARRKKIMANHSATHLMQAALRSVLGEHVMQKGSYVSDDRIRFDFSHGIQMTAEEIAHVERIVNDSIRQNTSVVTEVMSYSDASDSGAMALFGEKYGDVVRVVSIGMCENFVTPFSMELCGGTHVKRTGEIGVFKITGESSCMSGVRRIDAITGEAAFKLFQDIYSKVRTIASVAKISMSEIDSLPQKLEALIDENKILRKEAIRMGASDCALSSVVSESIGSAQFWHSSLSNHEVKSLKSVVDNMKRKIGSGVVMVSNIEAQDASDGSVDAKHKVTVIVGVTDDLVDRLSAVKLLSSAIGKVGGEKCGGRDDIAQGGGHNHFGIEALISSVRESIKSSF